MHDRLTHTHTSLGKSLVQTANYYGCHGLSQTQCKRQVI